MKKRFALALAILMILMVAIPASADETDPKLVVDNLYGFTANDLNGNQYTGEIFGEYDVTILNHWAVWCGPCLQELPHLQQMYATYESQGINVMGLFGVDSNNTIASGIEISEQYGLTYPSIVANDSQMLVDLVNSCQFIPNTFFIDSEGNILEWVVGGLSYDEFENKALGWQERLAEGIDPEAEAKLNEAMNVEGGTLKFATDFEGWFGFKAVQDGDRYVGMSGNKYIGDLESTVTTTVQLNAGQSLSFDYRVSTEEGYDFMRFLVNGVQVLEHSGIIDWTTYEFTAPETGSYTFTWTYEKDEAADDNEDAIYIDNVYVSDGDEPVPTPEPPVTTFDVKVFDPAVEIAINGEIYFEAADKYYIANNQDNIVTIGIAIPEGVDLDRCYIQNPFDWWTPKYFSDLPYENGYYIYSSEIDSLNTTGNCYSDIQIYIDQEYNVDEHYPNMLINVYGTPEDVDAFCAEYENVTWEYVEPEQPTPTPEQPTPTPEQPTPTPGQPTPTPEQPTPAPEQPTPTPGGEDPSDPPKAGGVSFALIGAAFAAIGSTAAVIRRKRR